MYIDSETVISAEQLGRSVPRPDAIHANPCSSTHPMTHPPAPACRTSMPNPKVVWGVFWVQVYFTGGKQGGAPARRRRASRPRAPSIRISGRRPLAPHGPESDRRPPTVITGRDVSCPAGSVAECC